MSESKRIGFSITALLTLSSSLLIHLWLVLASRIFSSAIPFGDISLYNFWAYQASIGEGIYGLQTDWVYPVLAFLPIWLPFAFSPEHYEIAWLVMVFVINTVIAIVLNRPAKISSPANAGYLYLLSLLLIGPVSISRIDVVSVVVALAGVVLLARNSEGFAATFFTLASWIKVWPAALFVALMAISKIKLRLIAIGASISVGIIALGYLVGNGSVLSFVQTQQGRGIQIESVIATPWLWLAKLGIADIYFEEEILTNQVSGPFVDQISNSSTALMFVGLSISFALALVAKKRGASDLKVYSLTALAAVLNLIVLNKVGSPQFMIWLAAALVAASYLGQRGWGILKGIILGIFALTQLVYPVFYIQLLALEDFPLVVITLRNFLLLGLLIWVNLRLGSKKLLK